MANLRLCVKNAIEFATLTASPAAQTSLPVTNLQIPARARVWRSTDDSVQTIYITWDGSGYYLNFLSLWRHNLESGATWRVEIFPTADWSGAASYDSGTVDAYDFATLGDLDFGVDPLGSSIFDGFLGQLYSLLYFTRVLALSVRITITGTGNSAGWVQASHLFAGDYTELAYNPASAALAWRDDTELERSDGGTPRGEGLVTYREIDFTIPWVSDTQRSTLMDMLRYAGKRKPVFASLYPAAGGEKERDYTLIGRLAEMPNVATDGARYNLHATQLRMTEI